MQRPARQHRGRDESTGRFRSLSLVAALLGVDHARAAAATRWPAAARSCRRTSRPSACRSFTNSTAVFDVEQPVTDEVRAELIGRGQLQGLARPRPASTPC